MIRKPSLHTEWLSLIEVSGPFLAVSVLEKAFPQGLEAVETPRRHSLRAAYEEWCDAVDENDPLLPELHREWIRLVFTEILEYDDDVLETDSKSTAKYTLVSPERTETFSPNWIVSAPNGGEPRLFVSIQAPGTDLEKVRKDDRWPASLIERMTSLCRVHGIRLGLITDGQRWLLVNAPSGATSTHASWYARLWFHEPVTLKAFQSLLGVRRCFGLEEETLDFLLEKSLEHQEEVTDTLGEQVRRAVEVLVQCLDKADADRNRELLRDVSPAELYEAGLTVMMRLVFVLCAEERSLLLSGDPVYDECYAVSTLRGQLAEEADRHGPEVLERRHDAWGRLLAVFRAVHGGIDHESLRMPPLGGSLFDPDRFPFLEGRPIGTLWRDSEAIPLSIDNRTVLLLLTSLQVLEQQGGALLLSYRALDVEQIGHVYEGLLEHTVARVPAVTVGLIGSRNAKNPNLPLAELESARLDGEKTLHVLLVETTKRSESAIRNALAKPVEDAVFGRLLAVCGGDTVLAERIYPYASLLRTNAWNDPIVYRKNAFMVTLGVDRRETGTHYTPKSLTESIVEKTLEPVAYVGPTEGKPRDEWRLKSSGDLLDLKVCDPAMGSGAFLVQACRWLSERLVEAWATEEASGKFVTSDGEVLDEATGLDPMPSALDERLLIARRLIAERCLYGVDVNPLAVELAKLSIWLVTLAKGRPFGFLDHNLRNGDSLLGIYRLDQLMKLKVTCDDSPFQQRIFGQNVADTVTEVLEIRKKLPTIPIRDIRDIKAMTDLDKEARKRIKAIELIADAMIGEALRAKGNKKALDSSLDSLAVLSGNFLNGNDKMGDILAKEAQKGLSIDLQKGKPHRKPFHWPLEYPEVFNRRNIGFDAVFGNPPFLHGRRISTTFGVAYLKWLCGFHSDVNGSADLVAYFALRMFSLLRDGGIQGFIATQGIAEGDTRETSLDWMLNNRGVIAYANPDIPWPGQASVRVCTIVVWKRITPQFPILAGKSVKFISSLLSSNTQAFTSHPKQLAENKPIAFTGTYVFGKGFILSEAQRGQFLLSYRRNQERIRPYLRGEDINRHPLQQHQDWVIDFGDMSEEEARKWPLLFGHLEKTVKPERAKQTKQVHEACFWKHWDKRPELYSLLAALDECLVHAFVGKHIGFAFVKADQIFAEPTSVFPSHSRALFTALQSSIHWVWVVERSSKLGTSIRYTASDCFRTFPLPESFERQDMEEVGRRYETYRREMMVSAQEGLTKTYNRFHDPREMADHVRMLRQLQVEMDNVVAAAYAWSDLDLQHGFYETKQGIRFTIAEDARMEVLLRLLELNHHRYMMEASLSLHDGKKHRVGKRTKTG